MKLPPAGTILTPRGRHLHDTCSILGRTYPASLGSLRSPFENFAPALVFVRVHAVARGTCHVTRGATWHIPSSFRRFGASNGLGPVRIRPSVRPLLTKALRPPCRCVLLGLNRWWRRRWRSLSLTWPIPFRLRELILVKRPRISELTYFFRDCLRQWRNPQSGFIKNSCSNPRKKPRPHSRESGRRS